MDCDKATAYCLCGFETSGACVFNFISQSIAGKDKSLNFIYHRKCLYNHMYHIKIECLGTLCCKKTKQKTYHQVFQ